MGSRMDDPATRAQIEAVLERRRREGRSSASGSHASAGQLAPASYPPPAPAEFGQSNRASAAAAEGREDELERRQRLLDEQAAAQAAREQRLREAEEEQQRLRHDVLKQVEVQKTIAAASENQLLWQRQQLEQQLQQQDGGGVEDRVRQRLAEREAKVAARLALGGAPPPAGLGPPTPVSQPSNRRESEMADRLQRIEDENQALRRRLAERDRGRFAGDLMDAFDERLRHSSPSPARPPYPYRGESPPPPPPPPVNTDPIFDRADRLPTPPRGRTTPPPAHGRPPVAAPAAPPPPPPPPPPQREAAGTPQDHMLMSKHAYVSHPVWDPQGSGVSAPYGDAQSRAGIGTPQPAYGQSHVPVHVHHPPPSPHRGAVQQMPAVAGPAGARPMSILEETEMKESQQPSIVPQDVRYAPQQSLLQPQMQQQQQHHHHHQPRTRHDINMAEALNDLKAGDWFIKWTKNDKPHLRWFWLSWKKVMLFWSNTQSASMLMANNIKLEEIVSLRSEQLTQEVPEEPGRPQIYYMICIKTYKRQLNIATRTREKFDKWYLVLDRLTKDYRDANDKAYQQTHPALQRVLSHTGGSRQRYPSAGASAAD